MSLRKLIVLGTVAVAASLAIGFYSESTPYDERLIGIQAERQLGRIDPAILKEPLDIQALLLDYSGDSVLVMKAWIALSTYPSQSRNVFRKFGSEQEFQEILRHYGEVVIPVIQYFIDNDVLTIRAAAALKEGIDSITEMAETVWNRARGLDPAPPNPGMAKTVIGPTERGWQAVIFIRSEGYKFLDQFDIDANTQVKWNQTNRVVSGVGAFFSSGLIKLEKKLDLNEKVTIDDVFFAGIDFLPLAVSLKLLRTGKVVATSGKELGLLSRTRIFAARLIPRNPLFRKFGKYAAVVATVYVVVSHPSLINSILEEAAKLMGLDPWLLQTAGWTVLIAAMLYPVSWLLKGLASVLLFSLSWLEKSPKKFARI